MSDFRTLMNSLERFFSGEVPQRILYESEMLINSVAYVNGIAYDDAMDRSFDVEFHPEAEECFQNMRRLVSQYARTCVAGAA